MDSQIRDGNPNSTNAVGHTGMVDVRFMIICVEFSKGG